MLNDTTEWVIVELTARGDGEDPEILVQSIQTVIKGADVFVPALISEVEGEKVVKYLWEGYVFIRRQHSTAVYGKLENTKYVSKVLTKPGLGRERQLSTISAREVDKLKRQIKAETDQGIRQGDEVKITSGPYKGLSGRIVEEITEEDSVQVFIQLRSKEAIVTLPRSFLSFVAHSREALPMSKQGDVLARWRSWHTRTWRLLEWPQDALQGILVAHREWKKVNNLVARGRAAEDFIRALQADMSIVLVLDKWKTWKTLNRWVKKRQAVRRGLAKYDESMLGAVTGKADKLLVLCDLLSRARKLADTLESFERRLGAIGNPNMYQNVIIDGCNLAYRCSHADRKGIKDNQGRPIGMIVNVLTSLAATKKKYPHSILWIVWDGDRRRRLKMFPSYKSSRKEHPPEELSQIETLKSALPSMGIRQVYNPKEEADDIVASLVRGPLEGQRNLIVSTDRDFLQLVTPTDTLLCWHQPTKNDHRTEILFNPEGVVGQYGVDPTCIVQLRALVGDDGDDIPGVPRVPDKVLLSLLQTHGSVEDIYKSRLSGLTAKQYDNLRNFEKQAKVNLKLIALKTDIPVPVESASNKEVATKILLERGIKVEVLEGFFE